MVPAVVFRSAAEPGGVQEVDLLAVRLADVADVESPVIRSNDQRQGLRSP